FRNRATVPCIVGLSCHGLPEMTRLTRYFTARVSGASTSPLSRLFSASHASQSFATAPSALHPRYAAPAASGPPAAATDAAAAQMSPPPDDLSPDDLSPAALARSARTSRYATPAPPTARRTVLAFTASPPLALAAQRLAEPLRADRSQAADRAAD